VTTNAEDIPLTNFQLTIAKLFFSLPASEGFVLAGGAALIAQKLTSRPTQDLDFFTYREPDIAVARDELTTAANERGWAVKTLQDGASFCRLEVTGPEDLLVDIALDAQPEHQPTMSVAGPTYAPRELAARKVVALFDRFAARDFVDVFALTRTYTDADLSLGDVDIAALRGFFSDWADELRQVRS
jgi:predicted nucleotidyltransferase component of viral defense system